MPGPCTKQMQSEQREASSFRDHSLPSQRSCIPSSLAPVSFSWPNPPTPDISGFLLAHRHSCKPWGLFFLSLWQQSAQKSSVPNSKMLCLGCCPMEKPMFFLLTATFKLTYHPLHRLLQLWLSCFHNLRTFGSPLCLQGTIPSEDRAALKCQLKPTEVLKHWSKLMVLQCALMISFRHGGGE